MSIVVRFKLSKLIIGQTLYRVSDQKKFEVSRVNSSGIYLCHFKGNCSEIIHLCKNMTEEEFLSKFGGTYEKSFNTHVLLAEAHAMSLREFFNHHVLNAGDVKIVIKQG